MNGIFTEHFHFFVHGRTFVLLFSSAHFIDHELHQRIFHITDAKYVMFRVGWRKSLKGSMTPLTESVE